VIVKLSCNRVESFLEDDPESESKQAAARRVLIKGDDHKEPCDTRPCMIRLSYQYFLSITRVSVGINGKEAALK
jgi:hypothetical protein